MDYLTYSERMDYLLEMIQKGRLLSLGEAADKFECSERTIKRMLCNLRMKGHEIKYCKRNRKFFTDF